MPTTSVLKKDQRRLVPTLAAALAVAGASSLPAQAIIFVDGAGGSNANAGDSWANAVATINQAGLLLTPGTDSEIRVAQGTYTENVLIETDDMLLDITGGWDPVTENRTVDPTNTVIDGGGVNQVLRVRDTGTGFNTEIFLRVDGIEFTNGTGNPDDPNDTKRGAVHFSGIFAQITNCAVTNCTVGAEAANRGVFYWKVGIPANVPEVVDPPFLTSLIENVRFEGNTGGGFGSAIFTEGLNTNGFIRNCQFISNTYTGTQGRGAICVNASAGGAIEGCTFEGNSAPGSTTGAGALTIIGASSITVQDSLFHNNSSREGGAVQVDNASASATFIGCMFRQNTSTVNGGALYIANGSVELDGCVVAGNTANSNGGGVFILTTVADLLATDTVFASNTATVADGGAIMGASAAEASFTLRRCVLAGNEVFGAREGGAIFADGMNGALLENCLVLGNQAGRGAVLSSDNLGADGLIMANCTVAENFRTDGSTQGIFRVSGIPASSSLQYINNLFFDNTVATSPEADAVLFHVGATEPVLDNNLFFPDPATGAGASPVAYRNDGGLLDVAGLNAGVGNANVGLDPMLVMESLSATTGTWSNVQADTPSAGLTTLTDASASFGANALAGGVINPDTTQARYAYVLSNTATQVVVIGDAYAAAGGAGYKFADARLAMATSGAVDRGRSSFPVPGSDILGVARGLDGDGVVNSPVAGDFDIGAHEFNPSADVSDWQLFSY